MSLAFVPRFPFKFDHAFCKNNKHAREDTTDFSMTYRTCSTVPVRTRQRHQYCAAPGCMLSRAFSGSQSPTFFCESLGMNEELTPCWRKFGLVIPPPLPPMPPLSASRLRYEYCKHILRFSKLPTSRPVCSRRKTDPLMPMFFATSVVNVAASVTKDAMFTRMFGTTKPKPLPISTLALFAGRDSMTIAARSGIAIAV